MFVQFYQQTFVTIPKRRWKDTHITCQDNEKRLGEIFKQAENTNKEMDCNLKSHYIWTKQGQRDPIIFTHSREMVKCIE